MGTLLQDLRYALRTLLAEGESAALLRTLRSALWEVDPGQSIYHEATLEELVRSTLVERRFDLLLIGAFAVVALVLCTIDDDRATDGMIMNEATAPA